MPGGEADGVCSALPCSDSVAVDVTRRDEGVFAPGTYEFLFEIESGNPIAAQCALKDGALSCTGASAVSVRLTDGAARFVVTLADRAPERLMMRVAFESREVGAELLVPEYEYLSADDPDCGLTCLQGTAALRTAAFANR